MKAFNPEKELRKIQHGNKNKIIIGVIAFLIILGIGSTYALYQVRYSKRIIYTKVAPFNNKDINILAVYLDGTPSSDNNFPEKGSGYKFERLDCDNNDEDYTIAYWNYSRWSLIVDSKGPNKCDAYFRKIDKYEDSSGANAPELYQGLIPVYYDASGKIYVANLEEEWYDYDKHNWANAVLVDASNDTIKSRYFNEDGTLKSEMENKEISLNDILQMYVWIPRYKYQLFNVANESINPQEIQIAFESGTLSTGTVDCSISDKGVESCNNAIKGEWFTHPAFKFGNTELTGIWVGKFEPSGSTTDVRILPDMDPLRNINISTMFDTSRNIEIQYASRYNLNKDELDTHMMKNMEWGAMAYLTQSKYGRCDASGSCSEITRNSKEYRTGYDDSNNLWNTTRGVRASTTENIYGIYDTSGDAWEYTMGSMLSSDGSFRPEQTGFNVVPKDKYHDKYEYDASNPLTHARGHLGDATRETLAIFGNADGGWYADFSRLPHDRYASWFMRGGQPYDGVGRDGIFAFEPFNGTARNSDTFRIVMTAQDGDDPDN